MQTKVYFETFSNFSDEHALSEVLVPVSKTRVPGRIQPEAGGGDFQ